MPRTSPLSLQPLSVWHLIVSGPGCQVPQQLSVSCDIQGRSSGLQGAESKADNATRAEGSKRLFGATKQSNCKKKKNRRKHSQHRHFFALESGLEAPLEGARAVEEDQSSAMSLELARSQEQEGSMDRSAGSLEGEDGSSGESASEKTARCFL